MVARGQLGTCLITGGNFRELKSSSAYVKLSHGGVCTTFIEELHHRIRGRRKHTAPGWALGGVPGEIEKPALARGLFTFCGEHCSYFRTANTFAKLHGDRAVTTKAESPDVVQVALAA